MRYAIVESGGKQYKAVEGHTIDVDRLADEEGAQLELRTLLMADSDDFLIGTPTVGGIQVKVTVLDHFRGEKVSRFKYSPKKRIRVRGGHRQQYTRLMVDFIGKPGEVRKIEKAAPVEAASKETPRESAKEEPKAAEPKAKKSVEKKAPAKSPAKKPAATSKSTTKSTTKKTSK